MRKLVYSPEQLDENGKKIKDGEAYHVERSQKDNLRRHRRFSHVQGDIVEYIGKDKKNRGIGIVLFECDAMGHTFEQACEYHGGEFVKEEHINYLRIFWQNTLLEETLHKGFLRKIPDCKIGVILNRKV